MSTATQQLFDANGLPMNEAPKPMVQATETAAGLIDSAVKKMSNADYHSHGAISNSKLKLFSASRKLYRSIYVDKTMAYNVTPAMQLGSLVHCMLLEPENLHRQYVVAPQVDRRTKEGKATWATFCETAGKREVVKFEVWEEAQAICKAVLANPMVQSIFNLCDAFEVPHFWIDGRTGAACRCKFDLVSFTQDMVFDFKITTEVSPEDFARQMANMNYDGQDAWYSDGYTAMTGRVPNFVFVVVQKEPPYEIGFYELHADDIDNARKRNARLVTALRECEMSGNWELPHEKEIQTIRLPRFASYRDEYTSF